MPVDVVELGDGALSSFLDSSVLAVCCWFNPWNFGLCLHALHILLHALHSLHVLLHILIVMLIHGGLIVRLDADILSSVGVFGAPHCFGAVLPYSPASAFRAKSCTH